MAVAPEQRDGPWPAARVPAAPGRRSRDRTEPGRRPRQRLHSSRARRPRRGRADEVPPHQELLVERLAAEQQHRAPARRATDRDRLATAPGDAATPASGSPSTAGRRTGRARRARTPGPAAASSRRPGWSLEVGAEDGARTPSSAKPCRRPAELAVTSRPSTARRPRAGRRGARRPAPCAARVGQRHPQLHAVERPVTPSVESRRGRCPGRPSSGSARPGRTSCSLPRLSWWSTSPSSSQVTVCRPVCGCGGTRIGDSAGSEGP